MNENKKLMSGIKSKLLAAVCMLLVAVIMVVSSTYAWFTLSTAPEVTGITTAVGANGALEMLLLTYDGTTLVYNDDVVNSDDQTVRNTYWGNLVDLKTGYGLEGITLYPSVLTGNTFGNTVLKVPEYGVDGRVSQLADIGVIGYYDDGFFYPSIDNILQGYGVRAVGVSSGMTPKQLAYTSALNSARTATSTAQKAAATSLNANGSMLANTVIKKATGGDSATYGSEDVIAIRSIIDSLIDNVIPQIEQAYKQYILVYATSTAVPGNAYEAIQASANDSNVTLKAFVEALTTNGVTLPDGLSASFSDVYDMSTDVTNADDALQELENALEADTNATFTWTQLNTALTHLVKVDSMKVNGLSPEQVKDNMQQLIDKVLEDSGVSVEMGSGAGIYADVADHCGNYTASVTIAEVTYGGLTLKNQKANMKTVSSVETPYLSAMQTVVDIGADTTGAEETPITEFYGYIVDLAFRTNAAESNLLLQQEGIDRIYEDNDPSQSQTLGAGSSMTFLSTDIRFGTQDVLDLMSAIRIVFFTPATTQNGQNTVIRTAKLDVSDYAVGTDGSVTCNMHFYEEDVYYTVTGDDTCSKVYKSGDKFYTDKACTQEYTPSGTAVIASNATTDLIVVDDEVITSLPQDVATNISVLVYLDGNIIGNDDVVAEQAKSVTGSMNLQFASSATLDPMDYAEYYKPASGNDDAGTEG